MNVDGHLKRHTVLQVEMEDTVAETDAEAVVKETAKKTPSLEEEIKAVGLCSVLTRQVMTAPSVATENTVSLYGSTPLCQLWPLPDQFRLFPVLFSHHVTLFTAVSIGERTGSVP